MKKTLSLVLTLALVIAIAMGVGVPAFAYTSQTAGGITFGDSYDDGYVTLDTVISSWPGHFAIGTNDTVTVGDLFWTGTIGSAESSGTLSFLKENHNGVTWTLKDGVLILHANTNVRTITTAGIGSNSPFWNNEHIETIVIDGDISMIEIVSPGYRNIMSLGNLGIINGYEDGNFHYTDSLTREQAATIIQRTATVLGIELPDGDIPFTDDISDWALDGVRHCYAAGIMNGYDDTNFGAKDNYTYEQALITVYRLYQYAVANG